MQIKTNQKFKFSSSKNSSETCPTCRRPSTNSQSLIKLFFEFDDNKASLNIEDILKTNDDLTQELNQLKTKATKFESDAIELEQKLREAKETINKLERQKQLDDMAIAGYRNIKSEATNEILKLNQALRTSKLDLLAEKQLRRIHQQKLHDFDPRNEDYDPNSIKLDIAPSAANPFELNGSAATNTPDSISFTTPFWRIGCEAKPVTAKSEAAAAAYVIPSKIQKANAKDKHMDRLAAYRDQRLAWNNAEQKPKAYHFIPPGSSSPKPSTSSSPKPEVNGNAFNKIQKRTFGEAGSLFAQNLSTIAANSTPNGAAGFIFNLTSPNFTFSSINQPSSMGNYRDIQTSSPVQKSEAGPKSSDR